MGRYDRYYEMREGGPRGSGIENEIFKCVKCGGETHHPAGHNGEPDPHNCGPNCSIHSSDWKPGNKQSRYNQNFERTFPNAPGSGL